ncbi:MAG: hypothetical protein HC927_01080 [Deltaproteobacteria bacterium]|nr:hypothetical protein [Deltaproteobacteria bacterium]
MIYVARDSSTRAVSDSEGQFTLTAWLERETLAVRYHRAGYSTAASDAELSAVGSNRLIVPLESSLEVTHSGVDSGRLVIAGKTRMERPASRAGKTTITGLLEGSYQVHVCGEQRYGSGKIELADRNAQLVVETAPWLTAKGVAVGPSGDPLVQYQVFAMPTRDPCGVFNRGGHGDRWSARPRAPGMMDRSRSPGSRPGLRSCTSWMSAARSRAS